MVDSMARTVNSAKIAWVAIADYAFPYTGGGTPAACGRSLHSGLVGSAGAAVAILAVFRLNHA
jgi:hypothetical protein